MVTKAQKIRVGLFISVISIIMIFFIIMVTGNKLMKKFDEYRIVYSEISVSGLQVGGSVKYHGISIGRIDDISIDRNDVRNVIVDISVTKGTPIKKDVIASLFPVGITGLLQIELTGGSNNAILLEPDSEIKSGTSTIASITNKAEILAVRLETVLVNLAEITNSDNQEKVAHILTNVDSLISDNKDEFTSFMTSLDSTTYYLSQISRESSEIIAEFNDVVQSSQFEKIINNFGAISDSLASADIKRTINELYETLSQVNETVSHLDRTHLTSRQDIIQSIEIMRETLEYLNEFARQINEDPSLLLRSKKK